MPDINKQVQINIKINSDGSGADEAKSKVEGFGGSLSRIGEIAAGLGLAKLAEDFINIGKSAASFAIETSGQFEQWKVSFDTMLGSSEKASQLLSEISDFAVKTPFELPQVVEGSQRLLAYNVAAKDIIPTFQMLGDISSGVGRDKLGQLILAFGQVKAATHLTGAELRQFSEAGVPLLQALTDQFNKNGGMVVASGGAHKKASVDVGELNDKLAIAKQRLSEVTANHKSHTSTIMNAQNAVQNLEQKIGSVGNATTTYTKKLVTLADVQQMVSDKKVSFEDVQSALSGMTEKGGKFFDLMNKQSKTFDGIVSNIKDNFTRLALEVMGFDMEKGSKTFGEVKKGSIFDQLREAAENFYNWVNAHREEIINFFKVLGSVISIATKVVGGLVLAIGFLKEHMEFTKSIVVFFGIIAIPTITAAVGALITAFGTLITVTIPALIVTFGPLILIAGLVAGAAYLLFKAWESNFGNIRGITQDVVNGIIDLINVLIGGINKLLAGIQSLAGVSGKKFQLGTIGQVDFGGNINGSAPKSVPTNTGGSLPGISSSVSKLTNVNITNNNYTSTDMTKSMRDIGWALRAN